MDEITKEECSASAAKGLICAMWRALGLFAHWSHQLHLPFPAIFIRRLPPHWSQTAHMRCPQRAPFSAQRNGSLSGRRSYRRSLQ